MAPQFQRAAFPPPPSDDEHETIPASNKSKPMTKTKARGSRDDVSSNTVVTSRTRGRELIKPSAKQQELNAAAALKKDAKILDLEKQLKRAQREAEKAKHVNKENVSIRNGRRTIHSDVESEEENDDEPMAMSFSTSIKSKGSYTVDSPPKKPALRPAGQHRVTQAKHTTQPSDVRARSPTMPLTPPRTSSPVNDDQQASLPAPAPWKGATTRGTKRPSSSPTSSPPPAKRKPLLKTAEYTVKGTKAKAEDYEPPVKSHLIAAANRFGAAILTQNAYPPATGSVYWAKILWDEQMGERDEDDRYELTSRMMSIIKSRASWARGVAKTWLRPLVKSHYKFEMSSKKKVITKNKDIYLDITNQDRFHYKNMDKKTGFAEGEVVREAARLVAFRSQSGLGVTQADLFRPYGPPFLAILLTVLELCIAEWKSGQWEEKSLDEKTDVKIYSKWGTRLHTWRDVNPTAVDKMLTRWHDKAREGTGAPEVDEAEVNEGMDLDQIKRDLANRTGDSDSSDSEDTEEQGFEAEDLDGEDGQGQSSNSRGVDDDAGDGGEELSNEQ